MSVARCPAQNFVATVTNPTTTDIVTSRLDHQLSTNDRLSGTFNLSRIIQDYPSPLPASATNVFTRARQSWAIVAAFVQRKFN